MPHPLTRHHSSATVHEEYPANQGGTMKKLALLLALAIVAAAPVTAMAKTKKPAKPAQQVQTDPQKMTFDEAMEVNKRNLSLIPKGLPLVLPSWSLPVYFAVTKEEEPAKPAKKHAKKKM
jgi:hypothetical protein